MTTLNPTRMRTLTLAAAAAFAAGTLLVANPASAATQTSAKTTPNTAVHGGGLDKLDLRGSEPVVFGHRGASGYRPEHTLAAYDLAIQQGADYIEPDVVSTKDGVLVARHENEISGTTDVADRPEFADRKTTKTIDGKALTGWFTEDFTLAELKTLRAVERIPGDRPGNTAYDGLFEVPTIEEVLDLVEAKEAETGRTIGVAPETKHPTYFDSIGLSMEEPLVKSLKRHGLGGKRAAAVIQSFEVSNLKDLDRMIGTKLVQLIDFGGAPYDQVVAGTGVTNDYLVTDKGLRGIKKYADQVAPYKYYFIPRDADGTLGEPTDLATRAERVGLPTVIWTLRAENKNLPAECRIGTDPIAIGDLACEVGPYLDAGVDAFFTDHPDLGVAARDAWLKNG
ncbi:glycerophosphodiester phosphodiesterase [Nocardioides albus]|uniref:glycerophosphodiester phosphodiesterase n=1 Tax=Nocardioides albus TaxID=1841 RepID=A0A7W5A6C1_9ACTN|nr:glycerophosphodiester phosphodiesterase [Nocardioides albus]MBB3090318.1 glycerophosphoryl diester phosphodiesterase [Nocardioides albus]GGU29278.1 glycerophosphoryl diester phosphodiesterase [Nocardioides albus]